MRFLLVDTAFENGIAAIFEGDAIVRQIDIPLFANQSRHFFPLLQQMLKDSSIPLHELDFVASGIGPGSYTGMRVGAMIAKTFAYALQKPLVGVCSLRGLRPSSQGPFAALIDARISGAYMLKGVNGHPRPVFEAGPLAVELEKLDFSLKDVPLLVTTPGNRIRQRIEKNFSGQRWHWEEQSLSAQSLGNAAVEKFKQEKYSRDGSLDLMYLRATQAEIEAKPRAENPVCVAE